MSKGFSHRRSISRRRRTLLFVLGAAFGSSIGLVLGSLLTAWLGPSTLAALQRMFRRLTGDDSHPSYDLLPQ